MARLAFQAVTSVTQKRGLLTALWPCLEHVLLAMADQAVRYTALLQASSSTEVGYSTV
jgi:hypothetical protein